MGTLLILNRKMVCEVQMNKDKANAIGHWIAP